MGMFSPTCVEPGFYLSAMSPFLSSRQGNEQKEDGGLMNRCFRVVWLNVVVVIAAVLQAALLQPQEYETPKLVSCCQRGESRRCSECKRVAMAV